MFEDIIVEIESDITNMQENGQISVEREEEIYITDFEETQSDNTGTQTIIIDDDINSADADKIKPADVNTVGEKPLYYEHLTERQKQIYRYIKTAAQEMKTGLFSIGAVSSNENRFNDIAIAFRAFTSDNPQIFWLPSVYMISPDGSALAFEYKDSRYLMSKNEKDAAEKRLNAVVQKLVDNSKKLSSRLEKEIYFHDWLCQNVTYNTDGTENVYSAYGALVNGVAVCEGYSRAMQLLCDKVGIPCTVLYGSSRNVGHMWNIINPGDGWYHLDVTWDDDEEYNYVRHGYFNLSDQQILQDHKIFDMVQEGKYYIGEDDFNIFPYDCHLENYNYFVKKDLVFKGNYDIDKQLVLAAASSGKTSIEVWYEGRNYNEYLTQVNIALLQSGSDVWLSNYSNLGNSLVLWW